MPESPTSAPSETSHDIEHIPVDDDPRKWTSFRKNLTLALIASASLITGLTGNIQNPAVQEMHDKLGATTSQFSLSISIFILIQGWVPIMWSAISEIKGRKLVYLISLTLATAASVAVALSPNMQCVIGFRSLQAAGTSAVLNIGAATLADVFDPEERGAKMGIYYMAPLLGPAIGPILGGVLTTAFDWRAIFWFLALYTGLSCLSFVIFRDTYRKERSLVYQKALKSRLKQLSRLGGSTGKRKSRSSTRSSVITDGTKSPGEVTIVDHEKGAADKTENEGIQSLEKDWTQINISLRDVSPFKPIWLCIRRPNNLVILLSTGLSFGYNYMVTYAAARALAFNYGYDPLKIGFVILTFGLGCVSGSICGGRWSDRSLARLKEANGGYSYPEMRLRSTIPAILVLPPSIAVLGWLWQERVHIAVVCVVFFINGFFFIWPYASTLAYIVDANGGRSSSAVATNSAFRGLSAFLATELAAPLQDGLGNGWMMTLWAFLMLIGGLLTLLTYKKGKSWREKAELWEARSEGTEKI